MRTDTLHPTEDDLERYALGRLPEDDSAPLEEHLLLCASCRDRLEALDEYIAAMRTALTELESAAGSPSKERGVRPRFHFRLPRPVWAAAVAALALMVIALPVWRGNPESYTLELAAYRGGNPTLQATAPAGRLLQLRVDLRGLAPRPELVLEVADSSGRAVWEAPIDGTGETAAADISRQLDDGQYWIRVYAPAPRDGTRGELLREYGLRVE